MQYCRHTEN